MSERAGPDGAWLGPVDSSACLAWWRVSTVRQACGALARGLVLLYLLRSGDANCNSPGAVRTAAPHSIGVMFWRYVGDSSAFDAPRSLGRLETITFSRDGRKKRRKNGTVAQASERRGAQQGTDDPWCASWAAGLAASIRTCAATLLSGASGCAAVPLYLADRKGS